MAEPLANGMATSNQDVEMKDDAATEPTTNGEQEPQQSSIPEPVTQPASAAVPATQSPAPQAPAAIATPPPAAIATPPPASIAPPARPNSIPPPAPARPDKPVAHGGPTRQYLNQNVTPHLLEGMKYLAVYEPEKPLLWLADFLRERSKDVER